MSSQDNDLPPRKDLSAEIRNRRASMNSANKLTKTPAQQRTINLTSVSKSTSKTPISNSVCRSINFNQTSKENNSKLLSRSPAVNQTRSNRPLSQVNENNIAVNIIRQHHANYYRANVLRTNVRNLKTNLESRRLENHRNGVDRESLNNNLNNNNFHKKDQFNDASPSKLTSLLNSVNLLNEDKKKDQINATTTTDLNINSTNKQQSDRRSAIRSNRQLIETNELTNPQQTPNKQSNNSLTNASNHSTNSLKTPFKQLYPNAAVSPSLIKPPTAQLIRNDHSPLSNQDVFNYSNLQHHNNNKYFDDDQCITDTTHLRSNKQRNQHTNDKVYNQQTLSASCNRLCQVPNSNNLTSISSVTTASSTPTLNNNNLSGLLMSHSVIMRNYEIGDLIGEGNFAVVHQCTHTRTRRKYAMKVIDKRKCAGKEAMIENEVLILRKIKHPNIVQLYEDYDYANELVLVLELVYVCIFFF